MVSFAATIAPHGNMSDSKLRERIQDIAETPLQMRCRQRTLHIISLIGACGLLVLGYMVALSSHQTHAHSWNYDPSDGLHATFIACDIAFVGGDSATIVVESVSAAQVDPQVRLVDGLVTEIVAENKLKSCNKAPGDGCADMCVLRVTVPPEAAGSAVFTVTQSENETGPSFYLGEGIELKYISPEEFAKLPAGAAPSPCDGAGDGAGDGTGDDADGPVAKRQRLDHD